MGGRQNPAGEAQRSHKGASCASWHLLALLLIVFCKFLQDLTNADMDDKGVDVPFLDLVGYRESGYSIRWVYAMKTQEHTFVCVDYTPSHFVVSSNHYLIGPCGFVF